MHIMEGHVMLESDCTQPRTDPLVVLQDSSAQHLMPLNVEWQTLSVVSLGSHPSYDNPPPHSWRCWGGHHEGFTS